MTSKEYETLQPMASQAERDLAFLEPSMEVTDFSSTRDTRTQKKLRKRPWFAYKMNQTGRIYQVAIICLVSFVGFFIGLLLLRIPISPTSAYLLFKYGYTGSHQGLQVVKYDGSILDGPDRRKYFKISGFIYNFDNQFVPPQEFLLRFFNHDGDVIDQYQFSCCHDEFYPRKATSFHETFPLSSDEVGYFELKLR